MMRRVGNLGAVSRARAVLVETKGLGGEIANMLAESERPELPTKHATNDGGPGEHIRDTMETTKRLAGPIRPSGPKPPA